MQGDFPSRTTRLHRAPLFQDIQLYFIELLTPHLCLIIKIKTDAITFAHDSLMVPQNIFNIVCEGVVKILEGTM